MTEDQLQAKLYQYLNNTYGLKFHEKRMLIFAVPNGGSRNSIEATKLKATGVLAGVSDLIIIFDSQILFLELKVTNGIQSQVQKDFEQRINSNGFDYRIAFSYEESLEIIIKYFNL